MNIFYDYNLVITLSVKCSEICPYCSGETQYLTAKEIYPHRDDIEGMFYACIPCKAWVGTHKDEPMKSYGRIADKALRMKKSEVHKNFDVLWKEAVRDGRGRFTARNAAYKWLHEQMTTSLIREHCHIGMFNLEQCNEAISICKPYADKINQRPVFEIRCSNLGTMLKSDFTARAILKEISKMDFSLSKVGNRFMVNYKDTRYFFEIATLYRNPKRIIYLTFNNSQRKLKKR